MLINSHKLSITGKTSYFFRGNSARVPRVVASSASQELSHPFDNYPPPFWFCSLIHTALLCTVPSLAPQKLLRRKQSQHSFAGEKLVL